MICTKFAFFFILLLLPLFLIEMPKNNKRCIVNNCTSTLYRLYLVSGSSRQARNKCNKTENLNVNFNCLVFVRKTDKNMRTYHRSVPHYTLPCARLSQGKCHDFFVEFSSFDNFFFFFSLQPKLATNSFNILNIEHRAYDIKSHENENILYCILCLVC